VKHLVNRGFTYGFGHVSPDGTKFLVSIPKNASSFVKNSTGVAGWIGGNALDPRLQKSVNELVVVLRDPLDRWISGFAQYIHTYILYPHGPNTPYLSHETPTEYDYGMTVEQFTQQYSQLTERLIFDIINRFDDHVWPQIELFQELLPDLPRKYFYINNSFEIKISEYLGIDLNTIADRNVSDDNVTMKQLKEFFKQRFVIRPELAQRVKNMYAADYQLIEQIIHESR
jgi:hypothetical protein